MGLFKKRNKETKENIEDIEELSLESLEDLSDSEIENLSLEDMELDEILMYDQKTMKTGTSEIDDYEVKNANNIRREHLTAKEDYIEKKKEVAKSRANRKLVNGFIAIGLFVGLSICTYVVFQDEVLEMLNTMSTKTGETWGGLYNKDVKERIGNDLGTVGISTNKSVEENLSKSNLAKIKNSSVSFVKDIPKEMKATDFDKLKEGNYLIGQDLKEGIYYGEGTELIIYDNIKNMENKSKGKSIVLDGDFVMLSKGHLISLTKKGEFLPYKERKANIIPLDKLENGKKYQVGKDIKADVYSVTPQDKKGTVKLISEYNMTDEQPVIGTTKINIDSSETSFVVFDNIENVKKIK